MNANAQFTARQLAAALGVTAQAARQRLHATPPTSPLQVGGNQTAAWTLLDLPAGLAADLTAAWKAAEARGGRWRNLQHFVSDPPMSEKPRAPRAKSLPIDSRMFAGMRGVLDNFADAAKPTPAERALFWNETFLALEAATAAGRPEKKAKRALLRWLNERTFLAGNLDNLRRDFNRKLAKWQGSERRAEVLQDRRPEVNAARRIKLSAEDRGFLVATGLYKHGGEAAPTWRECHESGVLSNTLCTRHVQNPTIRSYVPKSIMREIRPELKALLPWRRGPRQARLNGAYIETTHDEAAGDWFSSDDFTLEVYFSVPNDKGGFDLTRGQWLPLIDCRSKKILDFILIPEKRYTGAHIRTLINHGCTKIGLPRCGFHFERGTWLKSKLVGGMLPWGDVQMNFAQRLGLKMSFAKAGNARAKIVENVGKLFQASLRDLPGWVGRNEQVIKFEAVQAAKRDVEAQRKTPADAGFYSFEEFFAALSAKVQRYNSTPQESEVLGGGPKVTMSPDEAWQRHQERDGAGAVVGLVKLPPECRYLLAARAWKVHVRRNGIHFTQSGEPFTFRDGLAAWQEQEVTAYFDPELPELLSVVNAAGQVLTVPREPRVSRFNATPEELAESNRSVAAWNHAQSARLAELRHDYLPPARLNIVSPEMAAVGQQMTAQREAAGAKTEARKQIAARAQSLARQRGLASPATGRMQEAVAAIFSVETEPERENERA